MTLRERLLATLDSEPRSAHEIAEQSGLSVQVVAPALGHLHRKGEVERIEHPDGLRRWRAAGHLRDA